MIDRYPRLDFAFQQAVDDVRVKLHALRVHWAIAIRNEPAPGDGEPIGAKPYFGDDVKVCPPPVVVVTGDIPRRAFLGLALRLRELVPDGGLSATLGGCTLYLICSRGGSPNEVRRELQEAVLACWSGGGHLLWRVHEDERVSALELYAHPTRLRSVAFDLLISEPLACKLQLLDDCACRQALLLRRRISVHPEPHHYAAGLGTANHLP
mmetsp:Transcript_110555/g.323465  ORF Transcript_110555/g.323465 Transcript_110555/m.323465 type:complete len:209 (+) Transcript_110555:1458-2084(+)